MKKCVCSDGHHERGTARWHRAYCRWYDHREAGHRIRAALWGWLADRVVRWA